MKVFCRSVSTVAVVVMERCVLGTAYETAVDESIFVMLPISNLAYTEGCTDTNLTVSVKFHVLLHMFKQSSNAR